MHPEPPLTSNETEYVVARNRLNGESPRTQQGDASARKGFWERMGPGLIISASFIGPGTITTRR